MTVTKAERICGGVAIIFGVVTVISSGRVLFAGADMGSVVPFVLWFNFLAGSLYCLAGFALWRHLPWAFKLAVAILVANVLVFAGLGLHIGSGRAFEMRTVGAMLFRILVWAAIVWALRRMTMTPARIT